MSRETGRATPMAPDDRRAAIVEAVIPLLVRQGAAVTTREIAEAAGVAEGTIYRVFPDKCALMHAAAQATMDPARSRAALAGIDPTLDLHQTVRAVAAHLLERMETVMSVMFALRGLDISRGGRFSDQGAQTERRPGPPAFVTEANRAGLAEVAAVFSRFREQFDVEPERAALVLRSLVFGSRHPGMDDTAGLTADEIATVLVSGLVSGSSKAGRPR